MFRRTRIGHQTPIIRHRLTLWLSIMLQLQAPTSQWQWALRHDETIASLILTITNRACSLALRISNSGSVPSSCAYDGRGPFRSSYMDYAWYLRVSHQRTTTLKQGTCPSPSALSSPTPHSSSPALPASKQDQPVASKSQVQASCSPVAAPPAPKPRQAVASKSQVQAPCSPAAALSTSKSHPVHTAPSEASTPLPRKKQKKPTYGIRSGGS
ncbi:uncharacterized protein F5147DRAFT_156247 [Suillus discolor]|uniref:Uncharacterized protein n=1 Tax=Suillus discolor TaxID=1912936 RepID=A0A9P7F775_9AGAM|nr:uncharacterized protein F5147DRAFT_156247 [Suillus discolor]KAG2109377.1 hypothetical protein F5147DRAFT_156247 [Suillus discolor]